LNDIAATKKPPKTGGGAKVLQQWIEATVALTKRHQ
tara:strand:+ start:182 stop:289 length:108 start_codon:yes stop_codon:yes gene_type:complete